MKVKILMAVAIVAGFAASMQAEFVAYKSKDKVDVYNNANSKNPEKQQFESWIVFATNGDYIPVVTDANAPVRIVTFKMPKELKGTINATINQQLVTDSAALAADPDYADIYKKQIWTQKDLDKKKRITSFMIDPSCIDNAAYNYNYVDGECEIANDFLKYAGPWSNVDMSSIRDASNNTNYFLQEYISGQDNGDKMYSSGLLAAGTLNGRSGDIKNFKGTFSYYEYDKNDATQDEVGSNSRYQLKLDKKGTDYVHRAGDMDEAANLLAVYLASKKYASTWDEIIEN